mgnify:CR=1 FL=1
MSHMDPVSGLSSSNSIRAERLKPEIEPKADCRCSIAVRCNSKMGRIRYVLRNSSDCSLCNLAGVGLVCSTLCDCPSVVQPRANENMYIRRLQLTGVTIYRPAVFRIVGAQAVRSLTGRSLLTFLSLCLYSLRRLELLTHSSQENLTRS